MTTREELHEISNRIVDLFDPRGQYGCSDFVQDMVLGNEIDTFGEDQKLWGILYDIGRFSFVFGFALGQMFESPVKEFQKDVSAIEAIIKEKGLLPFFPREKKAA